MPDKVCILTAGKGSRLNQRTNYFNKAILRIGNKAAISHIIDSFPRETEFVIALGYLGNIVRQYLDIAHPDHKISYVEIDKYSVPGTGPGYALLKCKEQLQQPFFYVACDTIIKNNIFPSDSMNYIVCDTISKKRSENYCTVGQMKGCKTRLIDKCKTGTDIAFTGLAHIYDYDIFWKTLQKDDHLVNDGYQLTPALEALPDLAVDMKKWFDIGSEEGLLQARKNFASIGNLDKNGEEIYLVNNKIVKYFYNHNIAHQRCERAKNLEGLVPVILNYSENFYSYSFIYGEDLFKRNDLPEIMPRLLDFTDERLWTVQHGDKNKQEFQKSCVNFYRHKSQERLAKFYKKTNIIDQEEIINNLPTEKIHHYLDKIDWHKLCDGKIGNFHGDFNPSNIVIDFEKKFTFIDWRQDFAGLLNYGDVYYDFAKMQSSLLMPHPSIKENKFCIKKSRGEIFVDVFVPNHIRESRDIFERWLVKNKYCLDKVNILSALVMLNMAPLHENPLDEWLYYFSKHLLSQFYGDI